MQINNAIKVKEITLRLSPRPGLRGPFHHSLLDQAADQRVSEVHRSHYSSVTVTTELYRSVEQVGVHYNHFQEPEQRLPVVPP